VHERIRFCVRARLEILEPYREAVSSGLGILATNGPLAVRALYRTVNRMWYAAGDTSTDFNWYTKRGLLAGVVTSTTLYWLNDKSDGREETWSFLDRRLRDVAQFGKGMPGVKAAAGQAGNLASLPFKALVGLRSTLGRAGGPRSHGSGTS
jgi:ubiquinone biosynthesis protein COQ9